MEQSPVTHQKKKNTRFTQMIIKLERGIFLNSQVCIQHCQAHSTLQGKCFISQIYSYKIYVK